MRGERHRGSRPQLARNVGPSAREQLGDGPLALRKRRKQRALTRATVGDVLIELRRRRLDHRPVARAEEFERLAPERRERAEIGAQRPGLGGDEHAAGPEHRVAGEGDVACDEREVVGGVARSRKRAQRTDARAVAQDKVPGSALESRGSACLRAALRARDRGPAGGNWGVWEASADRAERAGVIGVVVRQQNCPEPAARAQPGDERLYMRRERRPGVDQPRRLPAQNPCVRPLERERPGVCSAQADDLPVAQLDPLGVSGGGAHERRIAGARQRIRRTCASARMRRRRAIASASVAAWRSTSRSPRTRPRLQAGALSGARRAAAVNVGKQARWLARTLGRGGGTSLPGLVAERIDPGLAGALAAELELGSVLISGTNGKTTTTRLLAEAQRRAGRSVLSNREGSNLQRGITTALLEWAGRTGHLARRPAGIGVFEVDEGALPGAIAALHPRMVVITNLFRDQLDRYFEVDFIARLWSRSLERLPAGATLVLNADDPAVAFLGESAPGDVVYYGLEDARHAQIGLEHVADSRRCPRCDVDLRYERTFYAHLGRYACERCGWRRPSPQVTASRVELDSLEGGRLEVAAPWGSRRYTLPLAGLYNIYNALAAVAAAGALGVEPTAVEQALAGASAAFGRLEQVTIGDKRACLLLVKNPSGFNQALRLLLGEGGGDPAGLLLALNDNGPDGRDVSWIWDVDLERCRDERVAFVVAAGSRAWDLALRLEYAGLPRATPAGDGADGSVVVEEDVVRAFRMALARTPPGRTLYVLPTYTALWTLREQLVEEGHLRPFWQDEPQPRARP
jgi:UDP-N-acetylmuramyl tripeptide synthase